MITENSLEEYSRAEKAKNCPGKHVVYFFLEFYAKNFLEKISGTKRCLKNRKFFSLRKIVGPRILET